MFRYAFNSKVLQNKEILNYQNQNIHGVIMNQASWFLIDIHIHLSGYKNCTISQIIKFHT